MKKPARQDDARGKRGHEKSLTEREREVLRLMAEGYTSYQIGLHLAVSERTVESHREMLRRKTGAMNTVLILRAFYEFVPRKQVMLERSL